MRDYLKLLSTSLIVALSFASSQASYAMNQESSNGSTKLQKKIGDDNFDKIPEYQEPR